jgi:hypothetical protein
MLINSIFSICRYDSPCIKNKTLNKFKLYPRHLNGFINLLLVLFTSNIFSQEAFSPKCNDSNLTFNGIPSITLCEENINFVCEHQIGLGTQKTKASDLGTSILSGNICIVGDFLVDIPFTFLDATIKINPDVKIIVKESINGYDAGSILSVNNSKLFSCDKMWEGISLGFLSAIFTDNTVIEDARKAIQASTLCGIYVQRTTFNRNYIGMDLTSSYPGSSPGPLVWSFVSNKFTCSAPLNGTTSEITMCGIKLKDAFLYTFLNYSNYFSDIKYGI